MFFTRVPFVQRGSKFCFVVVADTLLRILHYCAMSSERDSFAKGIFSTFAKGFLLHKLLLKVNYLPLRVKKSRSHDMGQCHFHHAYSILHHCHAALPGSFARQPCPAALPGSLARQPCTAALPGNLARQPCPAALPGSLARQPCPAALPGSLARHP
jgi:hypothetical protein